MPPEAAAEPAAPEPTAADLAPTAAPDVPDVPEPPTEDTYETKLANAKAQSNGLQTELRKQMAIGKTASEELEALKAQVAADAEELEKDTLGFLKRKGRGYDALTADLLKDDEPALTPEQEKINELMAYKEATEIREREAAETAKQEQAQAAHQGNLDVVKRFLAEEDAEEKAGTYAYSSILGQEGEALSRMHKFHTDNHHEPSEEQQIEICNAVEAEAREQTHSNVKALLEADKTGAFGEFLKGLLSASKETEPNDGRATTRRKSQGNGAKTLNQRSTSTPGPRLDENGKRIRRTDEEKMAAALERLKANGMGDD